MTLKFSLEAIVSRRVTSLPPQLVPPHHVAMICEEEHDRVVPHPLLFEYVDDLAACLINRRDQRVVLCCLEPYLFLVLDPFRQCDLGDIVECHCSCPVLGPVFVRCHFLPLTVPDL